MNLYENLKINLSKTQNIWLITGVAGFIGSNLLDALLRLNQRVIGLDNFSTGYERNLREVQLMVSKEQWDNFRLIKGDIKNLEDCREACKGVKFILHHAALGSVPRSIDDPITTNQNNIDGFLKMLIAARDARVHRFIYAASSSTYGDHQDLPKRESNIGRPLSPYAVTKLVNELYADVFSRTYNIQTVGLRYFNVFGKRQDPNGAYAAVIPRWVASMIKGEPVYINGDGETSRDFCYVDNVVQANLLAALDSNVRIESQIYNVAVGETTSLNSIYSYIYNNLNKISPHLKHSKPIYRDFRPGDVRHSLADISKAKIHLGYQPTHSVFDGLNLSFEWYIRNSLRSIE